MDRIGWNLDEDPRLKSLRQTYSNYHVQKKFDMMSYTSGLLRRFPEATDSAVFFFFKLRASMLKLTINNHEWFR